MRHTHDTENVLGFCVNCYRVRWLAIEVEPDDEFFTGGINGTCRTCARQGMCPDPSCCERGTTEVK